MSAPGRETKPPDGHPDERVWLRGFEAGVLQMRHDFAGLIAERDALAARVERLEGALETMQRSRDRYREEWERARGREEAAARAAPSTDARGPDSAPPTA
jgi:hypothetical protein